MVSEWAEDTTGGSVELAGLINITDNGMANAVRARPGGWAVMTEPRGESLDVGEGYVERGRMSADAAGRR